MRDVQSWTALLLSLGVVVISIFATSLKLTSDRWRYRLSAAVLLVWLLGSLALGNHLNPFQRLFSASLGYILVFKACSFLVLPQQQVRSMPWPNRFIAFLVWPGIDLTGFAATRQPRIEDDSRFGKGLVRLILGVFALVLVSYYSSQLSQTLTTWIACFAILFAVHLGVSNMITEGLRAAGWLVPVLFDDPERSQSLSEFW